MHNGWEFGVCMANLECYFRIAPPYGGGLIYDFAYLRPGPGGPEQRGVYVELHAVGAVPAVSAGGLDMPREVLSQRQLMNNLVAGDQAAFGEIYDQLSVATYAICHHHLGSAAAVDEAMSGLWLYVWQNAAMLAGLEGSPWSIIIATAEHHAQYHARTETLARQSIVA